MADTREPRGQVMSLQRPITPRGVGALRTSSWRELKDGLVYVLTTPRLLALMWLAFLINLTAYPVSSGLLGTTQFEFRR